MNRKPRFTTIEYKPVRRYAPVEEMLNGRRIRQDALPEQTGYRDTGCELSPSCLRCPLERCRYEEPGGIRTVERAPRDCALRQRRAEGVGIMSLVEEFGMSRRSVFRSLARTRT
jgi:hypothetical protein